MEAAPDARRGPGRASSRSARTARPCRYKSVKELLPDTIKTIEKLYQEQERLYGRPLAASPTSTP
ncbi:MAG: hypothetical protein MZU95_08615 [Desulfomicrobium escambiense]|nr:hypothetical protein [Desulfomicrobium escambiense]